MAKKQERLTATFSIRRDSDAPYLFVGFNRKVSEKEMEAIEVQLDRQKKKLQENLIQDFGFGDYDDSLWVGHDIHSVSWKLAIPRMRKVTIKALRRVFGRGVQIEIKKEVWDPIPGQTVTIVTHSSFLNKEDIGWDDDEGEEDFVVGSPNVELSFCPSLSEEREQAFFNDFSCRYYVGEAEIDLNGMTFENGFNGKKVSLSRLKADVTRTARKYLGPETQVLHEEGEPIILEEACLGRRVFGAHWPDGIALTEEEREALS